MSYAVILFFKSFYPYEKVLSPFQKDRLNSIQQAFNAAPENTIPVENTGLMQM